MKKSVNKKIKFKKFFKQILYILMIFVILLPFLSINVYANDKNVKIEEIEIIELFDGKQKNIKVEEYKSTKNRKNVNFLGFDTLESSCDNRNLISSGHQGATDLCWAFANRNLIETFFRKKYNIEELVSVRHMDYSLSNFVEGSLNRNPGSEAAILATFTYFSTNQGPVKEENFPFDINLDSITVEKLKQNIENIYLEGFVVFPYIIKERIGNTIKYTVNTELNTVTNVSEIEINLIRNRIKRHIKEFGGVIATTSTENDWVTYESEEFIYNASEEGLPENHGVTIIGWDDNFCRNNPDGSTSGVKPISDGAWLVSDSNQPKTNQFYYISYDDVLIEKSIFGFNDILIGNRFDVYKHDLVGTNGYTQFNYISSEDNPVVKMANIYEKTDNAVEYLNKVSFYTLGNATIEAYYIPNADPNNLNWDFDENRKIGMVNVQNEGIQYFTIDANKSIVIPKGKFAIGLKMTDHTIVEAGKTRKFKIPIERENLFITMFSNISYKGQSYIMGLANKGKLEQNLPIRVYTSGQNLSPNTFLVSYDLQDGEGEFPSINVTEGSYVKNTQIPKKEGYRFIGWSPDPKITPIIKNTVFKAVWEQILDGGGDTNNNTQKNKVAFVFGDSKVEYVEIEEDGYVKNIPTPEKKEGYKFLGWNPNPKQVKVKEGDVFYALWEKIGLNTDSKTEIKYTPGTKNDGTQANIKIPNAGKSVTLILVIISITTVGVICFIKYKKIEI